MPEDTASTFWNHTEELARRLKVVLATIVISSIAMMVMPGKIDFLKNPIKNYEPIVPVLLRFIKERFLGDIQLIGLKLTAPIEIYVVASFVFGFIISIPVIVYEIFKFIDPALLPKEKREMYSFIAIVFILFIIGAVFGFAILLPTFIRSMFPFFTAVGAEIVVGINDFYSMLFFTTLLSGLIFTFPPFFVIIVRYGIVGTESIRNNRGYVYGGLLVLTLLFSPGGSPQENFILFIPMLILFEIGIFFARRYETAGKVQERKWFWQGEKCKFCDAKIPSNSMLCPYCNKAQV